MNGQNIQDTNTVIWRNSSTGRVEALVGGVALSLEGLGHCGPPPCGDEAHLPALAPHHVGPVAGPRAEPAGLGDALVRLPHEGGDLHQEEAGHHLEGDRAAAARRVHGGLVHKVLLVVVLEEVPRPDLLLLPIVLGVQVLQPGPQGLQ